MNTYTITVTYRRVSTKPELPQFYFQTCEIKSDTPAGARAALLTRGNMAPRLHYVVSRIEFV